MAIVRVGYPLAAETRQANYISAGFEITDAPEMDLGPHNTPPSIAETETTAHTGIHAYNMSLSTCFGPYIPSTLVTTAYRMGYWLRLGGSQTPTGNVLFVAARGKTVYDSPMIAVYMDFNANSLIVRRPHDEVPNAYADLDTSDMPDALQINDIWNHIGINYKGHLTEGFLSVYVNGIQVVNLVGDTLMYGQADGFHTTATHVWGAGNYTSGVTALLNNSWLDDMYVDSIVGEPDVAPPALRFLWSQCNAAGENAEWTPEGSLVNAENIDERPNDGDTTYNRAESSDLRDTFAAENIVLPPNYVISAVIPMAYAKRTNASIIGQLSLHAFDGLNYADSPNKNLLMDYTVPIWHRFTTQPDGSAWNEADFNAMEFGYQSEGAF